MISDAKFQRGIGLLQQHFNRNLTAEAIAIWREFLDDNLNDEEFTQAIKEAILGCEFFPTARKLVEFVNGGKESQALREWQTIIRAVARADESQLAYISIRGRVALQAVGGINTVGAADDKGRDNLQRQFTTVFCQCPEKDARSLPPAAVNPHPQSTSGKEYSPVPENIKAAMDELAKKRGMKGRRDNA